MQRRIFARFPFAPRSCARVASQIFLLSRVGLRAHRSRKGSLRAVQCKVALCLLRLWARRRDMRGGRARGVPQRDAEARAEKYRRYPIRLLRQLFKARQYGDKKSRTCKNTRRGQKIRLAPVAARQDKNVYGFEAHAEHYTLAACRQGED